MKNNKKNKAISGVIVAGAILTGGTMAAFENDDVTLDTEMRQSDEGTMGGSNEPVFVRHTIERKSNENDKNKNDIYIWWEINLNGNTNINYSITLYDNKSTEIETTEVESGVMAVSATFVDVPFGSFHAQITAIAPEGEVWEGATLGTDMVDILPEDATINSFIATKENPADHNGKGTVSATWNVDANDSTRSSSVVRLIGPTTHEPQIINFETNEVTFDNLDAGSYSVTVTIDSDDNTSEVKATSNEVTIEIPQTPIIGDVNIETTKTTFGKENGTAEISADITNGLSTTDVTFKLENQDDEIVKIVDGKATHKFEELAIGTYSYEVSIVGAVSKTGSITIVIDESTIPTITDHSVETTKAEFGQPDGTITLNSEVNNTNEDTIVVFRTISSRNVNRVQEVNVTDSTATATFEKLSVGQYTYEISIKNDPNANNNKIIGTTTILVEEDTLPEEGDIGMKPGHEGETVINEDGSQVIKGIKVTVDPKYNISKPKFAILQHGKEDETSKLATIIDIVDGIETDPGVFEMKDELNIKEETILAGYDVNFIGELPDGELYEVNLHNRPYGELSKSLSNGAIVGIIIGTAAITSLLAFTVVETKKFIRESKFSKEDNY